MNEITENLNIFEHVTEHDATYSSAVLKAIQYLMLEEKSSKSAIQFINKQISNASTRDLGYSILHKLLPDCADTVLEENAKNWATTAVSRHCDEQISAARFLVLVELIRKCNKKQEFYKHIVQTLLASIVSTCVWVHIKSPIAENALICLFNVMKYFPSTCIVHKNTIESYILQFLDTPAKFSVIREAGNSYHLLNQIGGSGPGNSIHMQNFQTSFAKLYNSLNSLYDQILAHCDEFPTSYNSIDRENIVQFKEIPPYLGNFDIYRIYNRRINNLVTFLMAMLECGYTVPKTIKPEIIEVIQRGLEIHVHGEDALTNKTLFNQMIQKHQIKLLFLIKALIQSLQHSFMRHSTIKLLVQYLIRVDECKCFLTNSFYKKSIFETISYWIEKCGEQIDEKTSNKLYNVIINDIKPKKNTLQMQISDVIKTKTNSQKKQEHTTVERKETHSERVQQAAKYSCEGALNLLEVLLKYVKLNIKKTTCSLLFNTITSTLLDLCVGIHDKPYDLLKNQRALFRVLVAVFEQHSYTIDLNLAVNILALGERNADGDIRAISKNGLSSLEKICQPVHPSLHLETRASNKEAEAQKADVHSKTVKVLRNYVIKAANNEATESPSKQTSAEVASVTKATQVEETEVATNGEKNDAYESDDSVDGNFELKVEDEYSEPPQKKVKYVEAVTEDNEEENLFDSFVDEVIS